MLALLLALPCAVEQTDVVVVGAGYAGLLTARRLVAAGHRVQVLEALDVAGVRARDFTWTSGPHANHTIELGAAYFGTEKQTPFVQAVFGELGFETYDFPAWVRARSTHTH